MNCQNCGAENEKDASFCKDCGNALIYPQEAPAVQPAQAPQAQEGQAPVMPPVQAPPYQTLPGQQPMIMPVQPIYYSQSLDGACVTGLILGIVSLVMFWFPFIPWILGPLALVFGAVGMKNVKQNPSMKSGYGMGVAGIVTGIIGIIAATLIFIVAIAVNA